MQFDVVAARLAVLPAAMPDPPDRLNPAVLGLEVRGPGAVDLRIPWPPGPRRQAAALVLLYPGPGGEAYLVLIRRPADDSRHAGEVALPAGEIEADDASPAAAALREATEEVGLDPAQAGVHVIGELGLVEIRASGFELTPVLALAEREPQLTADPREVAALHRVPLHHFAAGAPIEVVEEERRGLRIRYGVYPADGLRVWGATARVLGQLGALLGR
jgi:8-oxo-dGTP pyrophosphatase MutT (NUDIX family)